VTAVEGNRFGNQSGSRFQRIALRWLLAALIVLAVAYAADYTVFRYRLAAKRHPFGSATVNHYYLVHHKDGKDELIFDPPMAKACVHTLFPHAGDPPCWYLVRHTEQRTDL
jgi:hypothetical protein